MLEFKELLSKEKSISTIVGENPENLKRVLKNAQSKKCRSLPMGKIDEYELSCKIIDAINDELKKYKPIVTTNVTEMTMVDIVKAIKNAQSKKCLAKAMNRELQYQAALADELKFLAIKDSFTAKPVVNKIQVKIDELLSKPQTKTIKAQIEVLQSLL